MSIQIRELTPQELKTMLIQEEMDRERFALSNENLDSLSRYITDRIEPGGFMRAVLENNLKEACARADTYNRRRLFEYCEFLYNHAPGSCWGSPEKVEAWLARN